MDVQTCGEKLLNHRCDVITGSEHDFTSCELSVTDSVFKLDVRSNNYKDILEQDVTTLLSFILVKYDILFYFVVGKHILQITNLFY